MATILSAPTTLAENLHAVMLVEKGSDGQLRETWVYPGLEPATQSVLVARASFTEPILSRHQQLWHYSFPVADGLHRNLFPSTTAFAIIVVSRSFAPEPLLTLAKVLGDGYRASGSTQALTRAWMMAYAYGRVPRAMPSGHDLPSRSSVLSLPPESVAWDQRAFDLRKSYRPTGLKPLLASLGVEAVLVWTALMMRKRVAVLAETSADAIRACRVLPLLVAHRWDGTAVTAGTISTSTGPAAMMVPYACLTEWPFTAQAAGVQGGVTRTYPGNMLALDGPLGQGMRTRLAEGWAAQAAALATTAHVTAEGASAAAVFIGQSCSPGGWIAGFTDPSVTANSAGQAAGAATGAVDVQGQGQLWDVLVDLREGSRGVTVAEASKSSLGLPLSPLHKAVAAALMAALADPPSTDASVLAVVLAKNRELQGQLQAWFPNGVLAGAGVTSQDGATEAGAQDAVVVPFHAVLRGAAVPPTADRLLWAQALQEAGPGAAVARI